MTQSDTRPRRRRGAVAVGGLVGEVAEAAFRRHGLGHGEIARAWTELAGPELAAVSRPERLAYPRGYAEPSDKRLAGGTLTVAVDGARALELQYAAPSIIDAINTLFGYRVVGRIRLVRAEPPIGADRTPPRAPIAPTSGDEYSGIRSPGLRSALARRLAFGNVDDGGEDRSRAVSLQCG